MQKFDDILVLQTLVDFDFAHELGTMGGTFCLERCLTSDDFWITLTA
jgi:hypothetical protein